MTIDVTTLVRQSLAEELDQLRNEVRQLSEPLSEEAFWRKPVDPGNSVGHLVLHLTGNLRYLVGEKLGGSGYVRDRDREFTEKNVPGKTEALAGLDDAVAEFRRVVAKLDAERLTSPHPESRLGLVLKGLIHLVAHFALHRGQMSYIVRLNQSGT